MSKAAITRMGCKRHPLADEVRADLEPAEVAFLAELTWDDFRSTVNGRWAERVFLGCGRLVAGKHYIRGGLDDAGCKRIVAALGDKCAAESGRTVTTRWRYNGMVLSVRFRFAA